MTFLEQIFTWTLRASWHATILFAVILTIQWILRKQLTPRWRHALWFAFLIRLAIPYMPSSPLSALNLVPKTISIDTPSPTIQSPLPTPPMTVPTPLFPAAISQTPSSDIEQEKSVPQAAFSNPDINTEFFSGLEILAIGWLSIALILILRLVIQYLRFIHGLPLENTTKLPHLRAPLHKAKETLGLSKLRAQILVSTQVKSPCIIGLRRPILLIPEGLDCRLSAIELECVFLHELAHLKRKDIAFSWVMSILQSLHWFNPIVWLAMAKIRSDRELATDATVMKHADQNQRHCYGELIIKLLDQWRRPKMRPMGVVGMIESKRSIQNRIRGIANYSHLHRTPALAIAITAGLLLAFMLDSEIKSSTKTENTTSLSITVLANQSGTPVANCLVEIQALWWNTETSRLDHRDQEKQRATTNEAGQATIDNLPRQADKYRVRALHSDYLTTSIITDAPPGSLPLTEKLFLRRGRTIGGVVTAPNGNPISNVKISVQVSVAESGVHTEISESNPMTDELGHWRFKGVPEDAPSISLRFQHPQFALPPTIITNRQTGALNAYRNIQLPLSLLWKLKHQTVLKAGAKIRGRIRNEEGIPITQATIRLRTDSNDLAIKLDDTGNFESEHAYIGPVEGIILGDGYAPKMFAITVTEDSQIQDFTLSEGNQIRLRFTRSDGTPIDSVRVHPNDWFYGEQFEYGAKGSLSDSRGLFVWENAPDEPVEFNFLKSGFRSIRDRTISSSSETQTIQMENDLEVVINVTDENGTPLPAFSVQHGQPISQVQAGSSINWSIHESWKGYNGRIVIKETDPVVFSSRQDPLYTYRIEAQGFQSQISRVVNADEETVVLNLQLQAESGSNRRLELPSGEPLSGRSLWLLAANSTHTISEGSLGLKFRDGLRIRTDQNGTFSIPSRSEKHFILGLLPEGFLLDPADQSAPFTVKPWGTLTGTWSEDGQPVVGLKLSLATHQSPENQIPILHFEERATTDANGEFTFSRVPPFECDLFNWVSEGGGRSSGRFTKTISIVPGQETNVDIDHPRLRSIHGKVDFPEELRDRIDHQSISGMLIRTQPNLSMPESLQGKPKKIQAWYQQWIQTDEGARYHDLSRKGTSSLYIDAAGEFKTEKVHTGSYQLSFFFKENQEGLGPFQSDGVIAKVMNRFKITAASPFEIDLGTLPATIKVPLKENAELGDIPTDKNQNHLVLAPGAELHGRVLDHNGAPLQGAKLKTLGGGRESVTSDSDGRFRFKSTFMGTDTGTFKLIIVAPGHSPRILDLDASKGLKAHEIQLEIGKKLHLRFIDPKGDPVATVRIVPDNWARQQHALYTNKHFSAEDGSFTWNDAPNDPVEFQFSKRGYRFIRNHPLTAQETPYTMVVEPELKVTFNVTDESGKPIPEFIVDHGSPHESEPGVRSIHWSRNGGGRGLNGVLEIAEVSPVVIGGQFERSYYYRIESDGYRSFVTREVTADEGQVTLAATPEKVENPISTLQLPSGVPLSNSHLWLLEATGSVSLTEEFEVLAANGTVVDTDSGGQFTLPQREGNDFLLTALPEGFLLARRHDPSPFIVQPWSSIKGTWYEKGIPIRARILRLQHKQGTYSSAPNVSFHLQATTNEKGEFEFPIVPPVELELLHVINTGNGQQSGRFVQALSVEPGQEKRIAIQRPSIHRIKGKLRIPESLLDQIDFTRNFSMVLPKQSPPPTPMGIQEEPKKLREWFKQWFLTQEGKAYRELSRQAAGLTITPDGRFRADGLVPGKYQAQISFSERTARDLVSHDREMIATANFEIEIAEDSPSEIDLGEYPIKISMR